ncbi:MAG TPA: hypothetical protein VME01_11560, partial [Solirubrobacteraceae bacterium]|nr:hypothetical protein [Solirubrobacteraceae bacterium]
STVWVIEPVAPNRVVDIADTFELKLTAMSRHVSQLPHGAQRARGHLEAEARRLAALAPGAGVALAETFRAVVTAE